MRHFLVTRFNLRTGGWQTTRAGYEVTSDEWLEHRFALFETYCLPSVMNQSCDGFEWCIYFDVATPQSFRRRVDALQETYPSIRVFYIDGLQQQQQFFSRYVRDCLDANDEFVITTRLDNDDLVHEDFIKTIQEQFIPVHDTVIDLRSGFQVSLTATGAEIRNYRTRFNPFVSLIEAVDQVETVIAKKHYEWERCASVVAYSRQPLWIELVHERNMLNHTRNRFWRRPGIDNRRFGLVEATGFYDKPTVAMFSNLFNFKALLYFLRDMLVRK